MLVKRPCHDLDFVVPSGAIKLAFQVGDAFGWPAYALDKERDTGRVVLPDGKMTLDFAAFRGRTLEDDLRDRDFTINAIALPATANRYSSLIDPTDGQAALEQGVIELANPDALRSDPVRTLRAIRQALTFDFVLSSETEEALLNAVLMLTQISPERIRDEFLKLLNTAVPDQAIHQLIHYQLLAQISPELHVLFADKTVQTQIEALLDCIQQMQSWAGGDMGKRPFIALLQEKLGSYTARLQTHWSHSFDGGLDGQLIMRLGALFHLVAAKKAKARLQHLALSKQAVDYVGHLVKQHSRFDDLPPVEQLDRRALYRYFRDTQGTGLDSCLLGVARQWVGDQLVLTDAVQQQIAKAYLIFDAYFLHFEQIVEPVMLLNGRQLMQRFQLDPGPEIGRLLRLLKEEQAAGAVNSEEEAWRFVESVLH
jgi:tRNA nucleotidyltransferase/poly(A) polymerase